MDRSTIPEFEPNRFLPGGHLQTILSRYLVGKPVKLPSTTQRFNLDDGDQLVLLDSKPADWRPGRPVALLVHGLGGDANGIELVRLGARLVRLGVRVVRVNLRGAGLGAGLSRRLYSGASGPDVAAVAARLANDFPGSPIGLVGFSLGGCLVLNVASSGLAGLDCVIAAGAPVDLDACSRWMMHPSRRFYDRQFVYTMIPEVKRLHTRFPELGRLNLDHVSSVRDFDQAYTAPRNGFRSVDDYYAQCSPVGKLDQIKVSGLLIHAMDDPFIPLGPLTNAKVSPSLEVEILPEGGHLGFISRKSWSGDRRWLVSRLAAWLSARWGLDFPAN